MEATEETLRELLEETRGFHRSVVQTNTGGGGGGSGAITGVVNAITLPFQILGRAVGLVSYALGSLTRIVKDVMVGFTNVLSGLMDFGKQLMENPSLGYFYGKLQEVASKIPILGELLGPFIGFLQKIAAINDEIFASYQKITNIGFNLGGSLTSLRTASINLAMSYEDTAKFVKENSRALHMLGGSADQAMMTFSQMSNTLRSSGAGQNLMALGYTSEQLNTGLIDYIALTGGRTSMEMKNTKALTEGAGNYLEQLNGLAKLTGEDRERLAEDMKKKAQNAAFEAKMATMSEKEREKAMAGLANALSTGGEGAADAFMAQVMGLAGPTTKAGQMYTGMFGESAAKIRQSGEMVFQTNKGVNDMNKLHLGTIQAQIAAGKKYSEQTLFALTTQDTQYANTVQTVIGRNNQLGKMTAEEQAKALARENLRNSEAGAMAASYQDLRELGQQIMSMFTPLITGLIGPLTAVVRSLMPQFELVIKKLTPYMKELAEYIGKLLTQFANWIANVNLEDLGRKISSWFNTFVEYGAKFLSWLKDMVTGDGLKSLQKELSFMFRELMIDMYSVIPGMEGKAAEQRAALEVEKASYELQKKYAKERADNEDAFAALEKTKGTKFLENFNQWSKNEQDEITRLQKKKNLSDSEKNELKTHEQKLKELYDTKEKVDRANRIISSQTAGERAMSRSQYEIGKNIEENTVWQAFKDRYGITAAGEKLDNMGGSMVKPPEGANGGVFLGPKSGYPVLLHGKEAVVPLADNVSKTELSSVSSSGSMSGDMGQQLLHLNLNMSQLLKQVKDLVEYSRKNVDATKSLNRNLFPV